MLEIDPDITKRDCDICKRWMNYDHEKQSFGAHGPIAWDQHTGPRCERCKKNLYGWSDEVGASISALNTFSAVHGNVEALLLMGWTKEHIAEAAKLFPEYMETITEIKRVRSKHVYSEDR